MVVFLEHEGVKFKADLSNPIDISIPIKQGANNPNCYYAEAVKFETITSGDFVGSVAKGGNVNYQKLQITPHGNGTHTECYGHITAHPQATISSVLQHSHFISALITLKPVAKGADLVLSYEEFLKKLPKGKIDALIIRTLPNDISKKNRKYSGTNPPYLDSRIAAFLNKNGVGHLVVDLPSVDKEVDEGKLAAHKAFWGVPSSIRESATITELAFIDNNIADGIYLLNLQTINIEVDASPSRPILYELLSFKEKNTLFAT